jgi:hypothetical protein
MAKTKTLALTTTPQQITPLTHCRSITIKEDESVVGWPTTNLIIQKPTSADDANVLTAGKSYTLTPKYPQDLFVAGQATQLWISVPSGSTTALQDEQ